jgi:hypothetical protein
MRKLARVRAVILGVQGTQYKITDNIQRHFENAVVAAVKEKDHNNIYPDILGAYAQYNEERVSPVKAFSDTLNVSEYSLQRGIYARLQGGIFGLPVQHIKHDTKLYKAIDRLTKDVTFATVTKLSADLAQEFYRVNGLREVHKRESIFAHEDVDFANKSSKQAYIPALEYLGYAEGDDLSSVLVAGDDKAHLACVREMGAMTAYIGDQNRSIIHGGDVDFEYQNVKVLLHEMHDAIRQEKAKAVIRRSWCDNIVWNMP